MASLCASPALCFRVVSHIDPRRFTGTQSWTNSVDTLPHSILREIDRGDWSTASFSAFQLSAHYVLLAIAVHRTQMPTNVRFWPMRTSTFAPHMSAYCPQSGHPNLDSSIVEEVVQRGEDARRSTALLELFNVRLAARRELLDRTKDTLRTAPLFFRHAEVLRRSCERMTALVTGGLQWILAAIGT